jgi:hypothetical protein
VQTDDGVIVGTFSSHGAAFCAYLRLSLPDYAPLGGWGPDDLNQFHKLQERVSKWTSR